MNTLFNHLLRMKQRYEVAVNGCRLDGNTSISQALEGKLDEHLQELAAELNQPLLAMDKAMGSHLWSAYANLFRRVRNVNYA